MTRGFVGSGREALGPARVGDEAALEIWVGIRPFLLEERADGVNVSGSPERTRDILRACQFAEASGLGAGIDLPVDQRRIELALAQLLGQERRGSVDRLSLRGDVVSALTLGRPLKP